MRNGLEDKIKRFSGSSEFAECEKSFPELEEKRKAFTEKYTPEKISDLTLEEYCIGRQNRDSFCYGLEYGLEKLGNIRGSYSSKFGVWFSAESGEYKFTKKWKGKTPEETLGKILEEIVKLLDYGKSKNIKAIDESPLSAVVKLKLLATFYPDSFLCISSSEHLDIFAKEFGIGNVGRLSPVAKNTELMKCKNSDPLTRDWSDYTFMIFLYRCVFPVNEMTPSDFDEILLGDTVPSGYKETAEKTKVRAESRKVFMQLKKLYKGVCQLCGDDTEEKYGCDITEGHHIEYFSVNQISGGQNLMCLCPNCHRMIHKMNLEFDRKEMCYYGFGGGEVKSLAVNKHLK